MLDRKGADMPSAERESPKRDHLLAQIRTAPAPAPLGDLSLQNETHLYLAAPKP